MMTGDGGGVIRSGTGLWGAGSTRETSNTGSNMMK